jgi:hypothetical protein
MVTVSTGPGMRAPDRASTNEVPKIPKIMMTGGMSVTFFPPGLRAESRKRRPLALSLSIQQKFALRIRQTFGFEPSAFQKHGESATLSFPGRAEYVLPPGNIATKKHGIISNAETHYLYI